MKNFDNLVEEGLPFEGFYLGGEAQQDYIPYSIGESFSKNQT